MNRPAGTAYYHKPRGSWKVKKIYAIDGGAPRVPLITDTDIYVTFEVTEPLLLSPFIFGSGYGKQGFYGIHSMNLQMVMNGNGNRAWRCARQKLDVTKTATVVGHEDSQLIFSFLTPHSSDMLDPRNVVPYYELPVYKTTGFQTLPGRNLNGQAD
ncbi:MAG: phage major capsid domain-containing protein, partial [Candidatus Fonsibacter sp.]